MKGSGDVKYHKGFSCDLRTPGGNVHVALAFNPSHLEVVNPVVEGSVRARQERRGDEHGEKVLPVLIHGDAAFAGQGVVHGNAAAVAGPRLLHRRHGARDHQQPGRLHHLDPRDARSTMYCSDVAKMLEAPIFHVNATIRRPWCSSRASRSSTACASGRTWSSTSSAIAASATTRPTSRRPPSRSCTR
jgi:2-oxoglutarate dehydrogenase E1 component